jgi:hypothetical protein
MGFGGHVDDRAFVGARFALVAGLGVDSAGGDPAGGLRVDRPIAEGADGSALGFDRGAV